MLIIYENNIEKLLEDKIILVGMNFIMVISIL